MFSTVLALCFLLKIISRSNYFAPTFSHISAKIQPKNWKQYFGWGARALWVSTLKNAIGNYTPFKTIKKI